MTALGAIATRKRDGALHRAVLCLPPTKLDNITLGLSSLINCLTQFVGYALINYFLLSPFSATHFAYRYMKAKNKFGNWVENL